MEFRDILKSQRSKLGLTLDDIARFVGVSGATVSRWENGDIENVRRDKIAKLSEILQVTPSYLMGWDEAQRPIPANIIPMPKTYQVPLVGTIACGQPILAVEEADEIVEVPEHINADFALRCKGDSMVNARIFDGDIVYIHSQPEVENGQIAAVRIGEEATLKKVYYNGQRLILRAANPLYDDLEYEGPVLDEVEVLGKAVAFTSMLPS